MDELIYINGKFLPRGEAKVSVLDHGFLYGNGVFETMRKIEIKRAIEDTVKANKLKDAYIRITISRGEGEPGLDPDLCQSPTVVVYAKEFKHYPEEWYRERIKIAVTSIKKIAPDYIKSPLKACNYYLPNFFAKLE